MSSTRVEKGDEHWTSRAFFTGAFGGAGHQISTPFTSAHEKVYDTTPGGNKSINPKSQFCRYTDPRRPSASPLSKGMGAFYSEAYDDNATRVSLRFGIRKHNPLSRYLSNFFDYDMSQLVNHGKVTTGIFSAYSIGKTLGTIYTLPLQAYFAVNYLFTRVSSALTNKPYSMYYYMEPTMPLYWTTFSTLVNQVAVNMGVVHGYKEEDLVEGKDGKPKVGKGITTTQIEELNRLIPDVIRTESNSVIDIKALASRAQRMQNAYAAKIADIALDESNTREDYEKKIQQSFSVNNFTPKEGNKSTDINDYLDMYSQTPTGIGVKDKFKPQVDGEAIDASAVEEVPVREESASFLDLLHAELREGSAFITYEVEYNGSISESFSNSTKSVAIMDQINQASGGVRDTIINFGGGNVGDGVIAGTMETAVGAVKGLLAGVVDSVGFGGLSSIGGGGFGIAPEVWENSMANLPSESYTVTLSTPYNNPMAVLLKIIVPMMGIVSGGLPRSTGKASYADPYLCSLHSQGRNDINLGIMDSIQIERGVSKIGFGKTGLPSAVKITFNVKPLDKMLHVPVADKLLGSLVSFSHFDEDTALTSYLSSIAGLDLYSRFYMAPRLKLAWAKTTADWDTLISPSMHAQFAAATGPGQLVSSILAASPNLRPF